MDSEKMKVEPIDVKDKIVVIRTKEEIDDHTMSDTGKELKRAGAIEVIFAIGEFAEIKLECFSDSELLAIGLTRVLPKRRSKKKQVIN